MVDDHQNFLQVYVFDLILEDVWLHVFDVQRLGEITYEKIGIANYNIIVKLIYILCNELKSCSVSYPFFLQSPFHVFFYHYYQMQHLITGSKFSKLQHHCSFLEDRHQDAEVASLESDMF